jgi:hypothetical protein
LAFFDEGDEPPTRAQARPSRTGSVSRGGRGGGGGLTNDPQTVRQRRLIALALGVLVFIVLAVGVNACLDSRAENRLKDYNRDVGTVVAQSDRDVSRPLFQALSQGGESPVELESQVNQLRNVAEGHVDQAEGFDVPDELTEAQRNLLLTLDMRASAIGKIAGQVRTALADGDRAEGAVRQIAAQDQQFLASDVIYDTRVRPFIEQALADKEIGGQDLVDSQFLPSLDWLQPSTVAQRLGASAAGGGNGTASDENVAPGLHGHGLVSVAVGDTTLQPGETANRIPAASDIAFKVTIANQGENNERNVTVSVAIRGGGTKTITARRRIPQTTAGANAEATIPLSQAPPIGTPVTITVAVARVPGEEKVDNNRQQYTAIFTR